MLTDILSGYRADITAIEEWVSGKWSDAETSL
jgi:hypothetical protein